MQKDTRNGQAQRKDHVKTEREGSHLQAKKGDLRGTQTCGPPDLGLPARELREN